MQEGKRAKRFIKRLEAEFSTGDKTHKGFLSNVSETGLFIRTRQSYKEGSPLDIRIFLPDGRTSNIKGIVRRAVTADASMLAKIGMGIELTHKDENFFDFLKAIGGGVSGMAGEAKAPSKERAEDVMLICPACGARNTVPADRLTLGPTCVMCKSLLVPKEELETPRPEKKEVEFIIVTCAACGVKNKVPSHKLSLGPRCGGCKEPLRTG